MPFHGELGNEYLEIKNLISARQIPLLGPATSHPWLRFGPLYYWIFAPLLFIFKFNPKVGIYSSEISGLLTVLLTYFTVSRIFKRRTGLIAGLLVSVSPQLIFLNNGSRFFSYVIPLEIVYFYLAIKIIRGEKSSLNFFLLAFIFGAAINFHFATLLLIPGTIYVFWVNKIKIKKQVIPMLSGISIFLIPPALYTLTTGNLMYLKFLAWFPYKFLQIFRGTGGGNLSGVIISGIKNTADFLANNFSVPGNRFNILIAVCFSALLAKIIAGKYGKESKFLVVTLVFGCLFLLTQKSPPNHYFIALQLIPLLLAAEFLAGSKGKLKFLLLFFFMFITFENSKYFFSDQWFYIESTKIQNGWVPYKVQNLITDKIVSDSVGRPFNLKRIGAFDYYDRNYAQNYIYLLWWKGNEPKTGETRLTYTIYDDSSLIPADLSKYHYLKAANTVILKSQDNKL